MNDDERCFICSNKISKNMAICPHCGSVIHRTEDKSIPRNRYDYNIDRNLESLEKMDDTLCHLEEELDAFLCKKR